MAFSDWRQNRQNRGDGSPVPVSGIILTLVIIVALLVALVSAYQGWNDRTSTEATPGPELNTQSSKEPVDVPQPAQ